MMPTIWKEAESALAQDREVGETKARQVRKKPDVRAEEILLTARDILAKEGYEGLTFRAVATSTGVRMSSIQYYYPSRESLYAAVVGKTTEAWYRDASDILRGDLAPEVRLDMICQWNITEILKADTRSILFQLLGMAQRESRIRSVLQEGYLEYRKLFAEVIREIRPDLGPVVIMTFATLFVSHLEGLTIFMDANDPARPPELLLRVLSKNFVTGFVAGLMSVTAAADIGSKLNALESTVLPN